MCAHEETWVRNLNKLAVYVLTTGPEAFCISEGPRETEELGISVVTSQQETRAFCPTSYITVPSPTAAAAAVRYAHSVVM
jgi:hypothetical protein